MSDPRHDRGRRAENAVADWLTEHGWRVLARRWRVPEGELDLVCVDPDECLVAVEVRLRSSGRVGSGLESIDRRRLYRLRAALARFARDSGLPPGDANGLRVDLVALAPQDGSPGLWQMTRYPAIDAW